MTSRYLTTLLNVVPFLTIAVLLSLFASGCSQHYAVSTSGMTAAVETKITVTRNASTKENSPDADSHTQEVTGTSASVAVTPLSYAQTRTTLNISPKISRVINALQYHVSEESFRTHWTRLNLTASGHVIESQVMELPFQQGRHYSPVDWLAAAGFKCYSDPDKQILVLENADTWEGLIMRGDRNYVTYFRADNAALFSIWKNQWLYKGGSLLESISKGKWFGNRQDDLLL